MENNEFSVKFTIEPRRDAVNLVNITSSPETNFIIEDNDEHLVLGNEIKGDDNQVIFVIGTFEKGKEYEFDFEFFCIDLYFHDIVHFQNLEEKKKNSMI